MTGTTLRNAPSRIIDWALPYWTRGEAGRETPSDLFRVLYASWLVAFTLKVLGSSWDVSWHFRWIRDDLAPPHLLNTVGTVIAVALTIVHWYTGYGVDRLASRMITWGSAIFLIAIPLDLINHRVNGLDITAWSPSHALLFIGTALMIAGVIRGWYLGAQEGTQKTVVLGVLFGFFLENLHFPAEQQEYGVLEVASWLRGEPYAEPELMNFAARQIGRPVDTIMVTKFSLPVPEWVYPLWIVIAGMAVLVVARHVIGRAWTATAISAGYVAYRSVIWPLLVVGGFPPSTVPYVMIAGGVCVDLAFLAVGAAINPQSSGSAARITRPLVGAALVTAGVYGGLGLQDRLLDAPPYSTPSWPIAFAGLAIVWFAIEQVIRAVRARRQALV
ncbi:hypothetical protein J5X84_18190 [Streptosporangiaceae bacterium NEAU-GS5]|nr:hypothetical protein [Streptosporangiaceae bacterium NEAU-GS5]